MLKIAMIGESTPLSDIIDFFLNNMKKDDLIFEHAYQVKAIYDSPSGKWQDIIADAVFLDSKKFFSLFGTKFFGRMTDVSKRSALTGNVMMFSEAKAMIELARLIVQTTDSKEYAMSANLKVKDSLSKYIKDSKWPSKLANILFKEKSFRHSFENRYLIKTPVQDIMEALTLIQYLNNATIAMLLLRMLFLTYLVIRTLIETDINDSVYEHAMLRTLGWQQSYTKCIIVINNLMYTALPGSLAGTSLALLMILAFKMAISAFEGFDVEVTLSYLTLFIGILAAFTLSCISMVFPIINSISLELRDALDIFRTKIDTVSVSFTKIQSQYGLSLNQAIVGFLLSAIGIALYVIVPYSMILGNKTGALGTLFGMFVFLKIGTSIIGCLFVHKVSLLFLGMFMPSKDKMFYLLQKQLDTNKRRNMMIGLTFITIISFYCDM
jgi:hypothetical protein